MFWQSDTIILASQSPRRKQLLEQIGIRPICKPVNIDESRNTNELPLDYCSRLALEKSQAGFNLSDSKLPALGSDTIVVLENNTLGKPESENDAITMLKDLSGKTHQVITCVAMTDIKHSKVTHCVSEVSFAPIPEEQILCYVKSGEPMDKAGSYAIQGYAAIWIKQINGSYSGIMGLPLYETARLLEKFL